jgi:UDP-N-acetylmuramyl pentapeptide phosphotransferase/UDP-N-acetylglucosamine-1-phosphate transferase
VFFLIRKYLIKKPHMKLLSCCLVLFTSIVATAQQIDSSVIVARTAREQQANQYMQEAAKAKKTGMVMAIGGGTLVLAGSVLASIALTNELTGLFVENYSSNNEGTATAGSV